jgi:hypothetical protein
MIPTVLLCAGILRIASVQAGDASDVEKFVEKVRSEKPEDRAQAEQSLKALPPSTAPRLKALALKEKDPDVKARMESILKHWLQVEGNALMAEGKLDAALLKLAEAENAADPAKYVRERLEKTTVELRRQVGGRMGFETGAVKPLKEMGPWALWVLLDALGDAPGEPRIPAVVSLLSQWGPDAVPHLCEAAKGKNGQKKRGAVSALLAMGGSPYPKLPGVLKEICADPDVDEGIKADARTVYIMVMHEPMDKK